MDEIKFGFGDVEDLKGYIEPGIEEVVIAGVEYKKNDNNKPYIGVKLITTDGSREHTERFFVSTEKGTKTSLKRIKSLLKEILGEQKANQDYTVEELNKMLVGKKGRMKFIGEEYEYNGEVRVRTSLAFMGFVESLDIKKEESRLTYNPNNSRDYIKLPAKPASVVESKKDGDSGGTAEYKVSDELF